MNIGELFFRAASNYPDRIAILDKEVSISYSELESDVLRTASYFKEKGITKGDRVLVFVPMGIDLYRIVLALFSIGATVVFLDEWVTKKRMEMCCEIADCKGFIGIFKARIIALFSQELRKIPIKLSLRKRSNSECSLVDMEEDETALLTFTTGSVGRPKAAKRTHGFLNEQFMAVLEEIEPKLEDVDLSLLPIVFLINLGVGCTSIIGDVKLGRPNKMILDSVVKQIQDNKVTRISASPFFVTKLAEYCVHNKIELPYLAKIFTGGAPIFPKEAILYKKAFSTTDVKIVYGSTEVDPISTIEASELIRKKQSLNIGLPVGKPFHKSTVRIIQIDKNPIEITSEISLNSFILSDGKIGEIIVSGPHVLKHYYNSDQAFRESKIVAENTIWHRTGDSGFLHNGVLYLTGRLTQLINYKGKLISPFIVENQLNEIEGIEKGTLLESNGLLILCLQSHLTHDELEKLTATIQKDEIKKMAKIPMDPRHNSKIDYAQLEKIICT